MDCNDCVERLYVFLDTELSETDLKSIRSHLEIHSNVHKPAVKPNYRHVRTEMPLGYGGTETSVCLIRPSISW